MTHRYNVFIREHQIVRFSIEVETAEDVRAAILEARQAIRAEWHAMVRASGDRDRRCGNLSRSMNSTPTRGRSRTPSTLNP